MKIFKRLFILMLVTTGISSLGYFGYQFIGNMMREQEISNRRTEEIIAHSKAQREQLDRKIAAIEPKIDKMRVLASNEQIARYQQSQNGVDYSPEFDATDSSTQESSDTDSASDTKTDSPDRFSRRRRAVRIGRSSYRKSYARSSRSYSSRSYSAGRSGGRLRARFR